MAEYKTQQKEVLLDFLYAHRDVPMRVEEIAQSLQDACENAPGKSTVYRLIGRLYEEGKVKRFEKGSSRTYFYQYAGDEDCHHHLHMRCLSCGKLLHMDHAQSEKLLREIYGDNEFLVDQEETTLLGRCRSCRTGKENAGEKE